MSHEMIPPRIPAAYFDEAPILVNELDPTRTYQLLLMHIVHTRKQNVNIKGILKFYQPILMRVSYI